MISRYFVVILIVLSAVTILSIPKAGLNLIVPNSVASQAENSTVISDMPYPVPESGFVEAPQISAISAIVVDNKTGITMYEKSPNLRHLPASTTKLMTALVALEQCSPGDVVKVQNIEGEGSQMGLEAGDKVTVENLLYGLLIPSGNDAAFVIARNCGSSYEQFMAAMNRKAKDLGMANTHFINPAGYDNQLQYTTASDLALLARVSVANPIIARIVKIKSTVVTDVTGTRTYYLENVNKLLGTVPGVEGVKTGETDGALENLITKTTRDGNSVLVAVLGSRDRFGDSKGLIEWSFQNYKWAGSGR